MMSSVVQDSPSAERNKELIFDVLKSKGAFDSLGESGVIRVMSIAEGSGAHMEHFAAKLANSSVPIRWYPTDPDPDSLASQAARIERSQLGKLVEAPNALELTDGGSSVSLPGLSMDVIININMIHISPWSATVGLMKFAGEILHKGGLLYLYGPYRVNGQCVESNIKFDQWLQEKDSRYGVRDFEKVVELAEQNGLKLAETVEMPANNLSVVFRKLNK